MNEQEFIIDYLSKVLSANAGVGFDLFFDEQAGTYYIEVSDEKLLSDDDFLQIQSNALDFFIAYFPDKNIVFIGVGEFGDLGEPICSIHKEFRVEGDFLLEQFSNIVRSVMADSQWSVKVSGEVNICSEEDCAYLKDVFFKVSLDTFGGNENILIDSFDGPRDKNGCFANNIDNVIMEAA